MLSDALVNLNVKQMYVFKFNFYEFNWNYIIVLLHTLHDVSIIQEYTKH